MLLLSMELTIGAYLQHVDLEVILAVLIVRPLQNNGVMGAVPEIAAMGAETTP